MRNPIHGKNSPMQNPSPGGGGGARPTRIDEHIERHSFPSGQVVEIRRIKITAEDQTGIWRTKELLEVDPPLADGSMPQDIRDIAECSLCFRLVCASQHVETCPGCGLVCCSSCMTVVEVKENVVRICRNCEAEVRRPHIARILKKLLWD